MRRITIIIDDNGFDVEEDGKICDGLSWDEMLGQIAMLTMHPSRVGKGFAMRTPAEWAEERNRLSPSDPEQAIPPLLLVCEPSHPVKAY